MEGLQSETDVSGNDEEPSDYLYIMLDNMLMELEK